MDGDKKPPKFCNGINFTLVPYTENQYVYHRKDTVQRNCKQYKDQYNHLWQ